MKFVKQQLALLLAVILALSSTVVVSAEYVPFAPFNTGTNVNMATLAAGQSGDGWTTNGTVLTLTGNSAANPVIITGAVTGGRRIEVQSGATAHATLDGVSVTGLADLQAPLLLNGGANLTITLVGNNTFTALSGSAGIQVTAGTTLTIEGTGSLYATGGMFGAGIGASNGADGGDIIINSGNINATGGNSAAGIGGGNSFGVSMPTHFGSITINGGNVVARTSNSGAGIGGGPQSIDGAITITGGHVDAIGGSGGAGVGGGSNGNSGTINISGGTVIASTNTASDGAGIGGGQTGSAGANQRGNAGNITISGNANVTATSVNGNGAGIGGGGSGSTNGGAGGNITITGSPTVTAVGGQGTSVGTHRNGGPGIGGGGGEPRGATANVTISGGTVSATGRNIAWDIDNYDIDFTGNLSPNITVPDLRLIMFNANGGAGTRYPQAVRLSSNFNIPVNTFARTNYVFNGWNTQSNGTGTSFADAATITNVSDNITLFAQWTTTVAPTYPVTVASGVTANISVSPVVAEVGDIITVTITPPAGQRLAANGITATGVTSFTGNTVGSTSVTFIKTTGATEVNATFENIPLNTFIITFNPNNGLVTPTNGVTGADGRLLTLPTPTRANYNFTGWFTQTTGGTQVIFGVAGTVFDADTTIFAQWTATAPTTYPVTVASDVTTYVSVSPATATVGDIITVTITPPTGQRLIDGGITATNTSVFTSNTTSSTVVTFVKTFGATVVNATFENIPLDTFAVIFDLNGGNINGDTSNVVIVNVTSGASITAPIPIRQDYTLTGWNSSVPNMTPNNITGNATFTAQWTQDIPMSHDVTITGGTTSHAVATAGQVITVTANTPPTGQRFSHWTSNPSVVFANANNANTTFVMPNSVVTIIANFETISTFAVTVNAGVGATGSGSFAQGQTVNITAGTAPAGQRFSHWTSSPVITFTNANNPNTSFIMSSNNVIVTAQWIAADNNQGGNNQGSNGGGNESRNYAWITPSRSIFDTTNPQDIVITLHSGDFSFRYLRFGNVTLERDRDFTVNNNRFTIKADFISTLELGQRRLTFQMNGGSNPTLAISVVDGTIAAPQPTPLPTPEPAEQILTLDPTPQPTPEPIPTPQPTPTPMPFPFIDVNPTTWYYPFVRAVWEQQLFQGTSYNIFTPQGSMTRAMFVQVLANLEDVDISVYRTQTATFNDTSPSTWYFAAIEWAASQGLVSGVGNGNFAPNRPITREEMAVMLNRYIVSRGIVLPQGETSLFADQNSMSYWAIEGVTAIQAAELITGHPDGRFAPQDTATRAEVATIFARFIVVADLPRRDGLSIVQPVDSSEE